MVNIGARFPNNKTTKHNNINKSKITKHATLTYYVIYTQLYNTGNNNTNDNNTNNNSNSVNDLNNNALLLLLLVLYLLLETFNENHNDSYLIE